MVDWRKVRSFIFTMMENIANMLYALWNTWEDAHTEIVPWQRFFYNVTIKAIWKTADFLKLLPIYCWSDIVNSGSKILWNRIKIYEKLLTNLLWSYIFLYKNGVFPKYFITAISSYPPLKSRNAYNLWDFRCMETSVIALAFLATNHRSYEVCWVLSFCLFLSRSKLVVNN